MNFQQAQEALAKGLKVKLSEWTGYWFRDHGPIKVFTKQGDILNTPYIERYKDRDDWEVTNGKMGFDFVILALKNGKMLSRESWIPGSNSPRFIYLVKGTSVEYENLRGAAKDAANKATLWECGDQGSSRFINDHIDAINCHGQLIIGWVPSQEDMMADDWMTV